MDIMKVSVIIYDNLSYIYCHNCENKSNENKCEDCHRKNMKWELSMQCARDIAQKIVDSDKN